MITPPYLNKGDRIAIVSPARKTSPEEVVNAIRVFENWGLEVVEGEHLYSSYHQFAGSDAQRSADLQQMLNDPSIKAIISSRGGYGTVRIIDRLEFSAFVQNPKWIIGYSDVTVLHSHINRHFKIETLHGEMPIYFKEKCESSPSILTLKKALFGKPLSYKLPFTEGCRKGSASGILAGGNLSIIYSLTNTASDIDTNDKILFLEDLDEYLYHIDRMMMNLKRSGKLEGLAGLIVGGMTKMRDNDVSFNKTAYEIIAEAVEDYSYPVFYGFPGGHADDNRALIFGRKVCMEIGDKFQLNF
jgi:muramoyltetrapeptide carboxypeptidase